MKPRVNLIIQLVFVVFQMAPFLWRITTNIECKDFDASGRFLNTFGSQGNNEDQFHYPNDACHLQHHFVPWSSASSLLLVTDSINNRLSMWSTDNHQHITNIQMKDYPCGECVDLNGFVTVSCGGCGHRMLFVFMIHARVINCCKLLLMIMKDQNQVNSNIPQACVLMISSL